MRKFLLTVSFLQFAIFTASLPTSLAQEWEVREARGTIRVVDLSLSSASIMLNFAEGLVTLDKDNNWEPCLAEDWRWTNDRTIDFRLRQGVTFHNGQKFNAETVKVNWEQYRRMESPRPLRWLDLPDETRFEVLDEFTVRFYLPEPDGLLFVKLHWFFQFAPAFFEKHKFNEKNYGYLPEAGPWGTGPFKLVEGNLSYGKPSDRVVLEAFERYWNPRYPKVKRVVFDNTLIVNREEAMRLCREEEGKVDIVSFIRPLDTLKVAKSPYAKVVKSKDTTSLGAWFNQRKRGSKWKDVKLRKAVNYAVNRRELWKYAAKGNAHNFGVEIPPGDYGHNPDLPHMNTTQKERDCCLEMRVILMDLT
jgi:peptide/nickel transport system substrate-binding protein